MLKIVIGLASGFWFHCMLTTRPSPLLNLCQCLLSDSTKESEEEKNDFVDNLSGSMASGGGRETLASSITNKTLRLEELIWGS